MGVIAVTAASSFYVPDLWLYQVAYERTERMRRELPDALDFRHVIEPGVAALAAERERELAAAAPGIVLPTGAERSWTFRRIRGRPLR